MNNLFHTNRWLRIGYGIIIGVIFNFSLDVVFSLVYSKYNLFQPATNYLYSIILTYIVFEILFFINRRITRLQKFKKHPIKKSFYLFFINSMIAIAIIEFLRIEYKILFDDSYFIGLQDELIVISLITLFTLIINTIELSLSLLYFWRTNLAELEKFKKENAEIRFETLRAQLNPHFLFNSLNTLSSLVYENQEKATLFIRELSDVYRYILENSAKELVDFREELFFAESFIKLLELRFGEKFTVEIDDKSKNQNYKIAPLTLQLLIENCVKHNIISKKKPLTVFVTIENNTLEVRNKLQPKNSIEPTSKTGLNNIVSRYSYLTNQKVLIENDGIDFTVRIPLINKGDRDEI